MGRSRAYLLQRLYSAISRTWLQRLWTGLHFVALRGMGFNNIRPEINGELRFLRRWAQQRRGTPARVVVIDAGANEGDFTTALLPLLDHLEIHCFEPNPPTFTRLEERLGGDARITLNRCGLSDRPGKLVLYDLARSGGTGVATCTPAALGDGADTEAVSIDVTSLDDYLSQHEIDFVDLFKLDVEGAEKQVLRGACASIGASKIGAIQLEWNYHNAITGFTLYQLAHMLEDFDVYRILPDGLRLLVTLDHAYRSRDEIFLYSNLVALNRRIYPGPADLDL